MFHFPRPRSFTPKTPLAKKCHLRSDWQAVTDRMALRTCCIFPFPLFFAVYKLIVSKFWPLDEIGDPLCNSLAGCSWNQRFYPGKKSLHRNISLLEVFNSSKSNSCSSILFPDMPSSTRVIYRFLLMVLCPDHQYARQSKCSRRVHGGVASST